MVPAPHQRAALASRISNSEYVRADLLVGLIHSALFKSIARYIDDDWRDDLVDFHFILDDKLPGKLATGEKELSLLLLPRLGNNDYGLVVPTNWQIDPVHPFVAKFNEGADKSGLNRIFEHGLRFEPSHDQAGLQLVDTIAYVARKAILEPDNEAIQRAYGSIRDNLRTERGGQGLTLRKRVLGISAENRLLEADMTLVARVISSLWLLANGRGASFRQTCLVGLSSRKRRAVTRHGFRGGRRMPRAATLHRTAR